LGHKNIPFCFRDQEQCPRLWDRSDEAATL
jgi:hypothetical protein